MSDGSLGHRLARLGQRVELFELTPELGLKDALELLARARLFARRCCFCRRRHVVVDAVVVVARSSREQVEIVLSHLDAESHVALDIVDVLEHELLSAARVTQILRILVVAAVCCCSLDAKRQLALALVGVVTGQRIVFVGVLVGVVALSGGGGGGGDRKRNAEVVIVFVDE